MEDTRLSGVSGKKGAVPGGCGPTPWVDGRGRRERRGAGDGQEVGLREKGRGRVPKRGERELGAGTASVPGEQGGESISRDAQFFQLCRI